MRAIRNRVLSAALAGAGLAASSLAALPAMAEGSLVIRDFVLSHAIDEREPVGTTDFFRVGDGTAVAYARIWNSGAPARVSFVWHYGEKTHASVPVNVGVSPGWRTWSTVNLRAGNWRVELVDAQGAVLAERFFTVGPNPAIPVARDAEEIPGIRDDIGGPVDDAVHREEIPASVVYPMR